MTTNYTGALAELLEGLEKLGIDITSFKYSAMDMDDEVYLYASRPTIGEHGVSWVVQNDFDRSHMLFYMTEAFSKRINWRDSLTRINQQGEV